MKQSAVDSFFTIQFAQEITSVSQQMPAVFIPKLVVRSSNQIYKKIKMASDQKPI